jgi:hypothetical protein
MCPVVERHPKIRTAEAVINALLTTPRVVAAETPRSFRCPRISRFHLTKITTAAAKVEDHSSWLDVEQMPRQRKVIHFARIPVTAA